MSSAESIAMRIRFNLIAVGLTALVLTACGKAVPDRSPSFDAPPGAASGSMSRTPADTSVPSAASVIAPATQAKPDAAAGRSNNAMSAAQESSAMPLPGQNNDHSASLRPATAASRP